MRHIYTSNKSTCIYLPVWFSTTSIKLNISPIIHIMTLPRDIMYIVSNYTSGTRKSYKNTFKSCLFQLRLFKYNKMMKPSQIKEYNTGIYLFYKFNPNWNLLIENWIIIRFYKYISSSFSRVSYAPSRHNISRLQLHLWK